MQRKSEAGYMAVGSSGKGRLVIFLSHFAFVSDIGWLIPGV